MEFTAIMRMRILGASDWRRKTMPGKIPIEELLIEWISDQKPAGAGTASCQEQ